MKISKRQLLQMIYEETQGYGKDVLSRSWGAEGEEADPKLDYDEQTADEEDVQRDNRDIGEGRLLEYASAPTRDELTVDISNIMIELQEIVDVNANGQTETPDMGGPDIGQQEEVADFVGDAIVNLERALSVLSVEGV